MAGLSIWYGGERYYLNSVYPTRKAAQYGAKYLRKAGRKTRILRGHREFVLYSRPKEARR